ncbi:MAG TPA: ATP-binding protein [Spirochaetales bacterium]|nr:ATP-binding protein [Spirochaetales bacterium]
MSGRSDLPGDFGDTYSKLLGLDESFSVKSHYPEFKAAERALLDINENLERALAELRNTQERLVQTRYQASVGRVLAAIAHELNSPLASTQSAADHLASIRREAIVAYRAMPAPLAGLVDRLLERQDDPPLVGRERREALAKRLAEAGCIGADDLADDLCDLGRVDVTEDDVALLSGPRGPEAVNVAWVLGSMFGSSSLVARAARRSAGVVRSLNAYLELSPPDESALVDFDIAEKLLGRYCEAGSTGRTVRFELEDGVSAYGDPDRLDLVWENLISNALFAAGIDGNVTVRARFDGAATVVEVEDDRPGVDPAIRDRLFEPYVSAKALEEGKGLGLDICKRIVDTHRGTITFESRPGRTVFTVRLPGEPDGADSL